MLEIREGLNGMNGFQMTAGPATDVGANVTLRLSSVRPCRFGSVGVPRDVIDRERPLLGVLL